MQSWVTTARSVRCPGEAEFAICSGHEENSSQMETTGPLRALAGRGSQRAARRSLVHRPPKLLPADNFPRST